MKTNYSPAEGGPGGGGGGAPGKEGGGGGTPPIRPEKYTCTFILYT